MRPRTMSLVSVIVGALLLATVAGVALARDIQCKPSWKCEGARRAEFLTGTISPDRIYGLGGGEFLFGSEASDRLVGGRGFDTLEGRTTRPTTP